MGKCKIVFGRGCRSTYGLSDPIIRRLKEADWCDLYLVDLIAGQYCPTVNLMEDYFISHDCDLFLAMADRIEMCAAVSVAFHYGVKIAHVYAGITNIPLSTLDDINRHCITLWSDITFCEDLQSAKVVYDLWCSIHKNKKYITNFVATKDYSREDFGGTNIYIVGITHMDDLELNTSLVPSEPYDLVLINPTITMEEIVEIESKFAIIIEPNPDNTELQVVNIEKVERYISYETLPRPQYLGLLKNCTRFISNSSDVYYIAPQWLKPEQIILIGERNKNRSTPKKLETGASDKIVKILKEWWEKQND